MATKLQRPITAIVVVTLVAMIGCLLNWGFGLVIGAVFAKALARRVRGVDYPLLVASAYSGFLVWHGGLSGSVPLTLSTGGETLVKLSGSTLTDAVPISMTIFSGYNLVIVGLILFVVPILNALMHPKNPTLVNPNLIQDKALVLPPINTPAQKLDDSRLMMMVLMMLAMGYFVVELSKSMNFGLNIVIGLFLFIGLLTHGTLERYYRAVNDGISGITGIVLLFPFYGGIMGLVTGANTDGVSIGW